MILIMALLAGGCAQPAATLYRCVRVVDGDTIVIEDAGGIRTRVRFRRIDAPELDEAGGPEAKATPATHINIKAVVMNLIISPCAFARLSKRIEWRSP